jgi:tRNA 2-thiouridine synthesizing protein A
METADQTLDARGMNCPLPILKTSKKLGVMDAGQTLLVITTDPGSVKDISAFCDQTGNQLVSSKSKGEEYMFLLRKS